ncbi:MAG: hypothetical protein LAN18_14330 [Acidobacteriia bacterium]|nr:hypothetical protein [Terriglobia bacterium]
MSTISRRGFVKGAALPLIAFYQPDLSTPAQPRNAHLLQVPPTASSNTSAPCTANGKLSCPALQL